MKQIAVRLVWPQFLENIKVSIAKIRDIAGTDRQDTNAHGLVKVIEHFGF
jgi:hypothetical protein